MKCSTALVQALCQLALSSSGCCTQTLNLSSVAYGVFVACYTE